MLEVKAGSVVTTMERFTRQTGGPVVSQLVPSYDIWYSAGIEDWLKIEDLN